MVLSYANNIQRKLSIFFLKCNWSPCVYLRLCRITKVMLVGMQF